MTDLSRRSLFAAGAWGAALSPFLGTGIANAVRPRAYSRERFRAMHRKRFRLTGPGRPWTARLVEISDLSTVQAGDDQAFGLTFRAKRRGPEQGTFTIQRRGFAPMSLFLVPTDTRRRTYYAVVNRSY